jgi:hypothetical protein
MSGGLFWRSTDGHGKAERHGERLLLACFNCSDSTRYQHECGPATSTYRASCIYVPHPCATNATISLWGHSCIYGTSSWRTSKQGQGCVCGACVLFVRFDALLYVHMRAALIDFSPLLPFAYLLHICEQRNNNLGCAHPWAVFHHTSANLQNEHRIIRIASTGNEAKDSDQLGLQTSVKARPMFRH